MKPPRLSSDLVSVDRFRDDPSTWLDRPAATGRPIVLTRDGQAAAALVSPRMLDDLEEEREVVREICAGLREVAAGEIVDDQQVWAEVDEIVERYEALPEALAS